LGKKHSADAPFVRGMIRILHKEVNKCETLCSLFASMALEAEVVNAM
jgi:hypothetical protein